MGQWAENHSLAELDAAMQEAIANTEESGDYLDAFPIKSNCSLNIPICT